MWQPYASIPRDGQPVAVFDPADFLPQVRVVHWDGSGWRYRPTRDWCHVAEAVLSGRQLRRGSTSIWADASILPVPKSEGAPGWRSMSEAPRDGLPFWRFHWVHVVGSPAGDYFEPRLELLLRDRADPESDGCWTSVVTSVSDFDGALGWWTVDVLPLDPMRHLAALKAYYWQKRRRREEWAAEQVALAG